MEESKELAELLFPNVKRDTEYYEKMYPARDLKEGARVTRFAPSPTGFLHFGNLFTALVAYRVARQSGGVFFVRVEDTDDKRRVENAVQVMLQGLKTYGIEADEGVMEDGLQKGEYGPYYQSERVEIYQTYAKKLTEEGYAYPCFCTEEELEELRKKQENESVKGYCGKWAKCRNLTLEEVKEKIAAGQKWVLRLKSPGTESGKCYLDDVVKGKLELPENMQDIVILKSNGVPTYHFAHVVDDHLMHTTHVIRGDEWLSSTPIHLQLAKMLGFKPPKYAHIAPIMKEENGGKRKLSKRKDPEMAITYYEKAGYPRASVTEYMLTLANSNFEDWRRVNKTADVAEFPFNIKKMGVSGALFDIVKLNDISKNMVSKMSCEEVFNQSYAWAKEYNTELCALYEKDKEYAKNVLNIDREKKNPRKDIAKWEDIPEYLSYMYEETFTPCYELSGNATPALALQVLEKYINVFDVKDDKDAWFEKIKAVCTECGCAVNMADYKKSPESYPGNVGDVSTVVRVALTGRVNTPDLFSITALLGKERVKKRLQDAIEYYEKAI